MPRRELSLREALEQWCDPALVERVRSEERQLSEYELNQTSRIQLTPLSERRQPTGTSWMVETDLTNWLAAWHALENDLRKRIGAGQFYVWGVQAKPLRLTRPELIPPAWAADMKFDFAVGAITVDEYRYTAIVCSLDPPLAEQAAEVVAVAQAAAEAAPAPSDAPQGTLREPSGRRGGRPGFPLQEMAAIARQRGRREPTNKSEARTLLTEFVQRFPERQPPSHRTVIGHVPKIYSEAKRLDRT